MNTNQQDKIKAEFRFNQYEIGCHLVIIAVHLYLSVMLLMNEAESNDGIMTTTSYLTNVIGKQRDCHDLQWETFRKNAPILIGCMVGWYFISKGIEEVKNQKAWILSLIVLIYCYRSDLIIFACLVGLWYVFTITYSTCQYFVPACWIITIAILLVNEQTHHFAYLSNLIEKMMPLSVMGSSFRQISCGQTLNLTFLRLLSFSFDRNRGNQSKQLSKHIQKCDICTEKEYCLKRRNYVEPDNYGILNYCNYLLFFPTFLAGPPITYKNFISFKKNRSCKGPEFERCILLFLSFQIFQHYLPVIKINLNQSLITMELITLFHLVFIWYKFLIIWRFHRAWAQLYGVEVVDNLSRCIFNNYCFEGFWRMWHRGFNQWLIRYLYIPLGGKNNLLSVVPTVAFVAFWHDHSLNIVVWSLVIVMFIVPEIVIKRYVEKNCRHLFKEHWFKYMCALTAALYIYVLVLANIVGFGYGVQNFLLLWVKIKSEWLSLIWSILVVASCVILMFYKRDVEQKKKNY